MASIIKFLLGNWMFYANIVMGMILVWWGVYATWFDKRVRVLMFYPDKRIQIHKANIVNGKQLKIGDKVYIFDQKACIVRATRYRYAVYYHDFPNPITIKPPKSKDYGGVYYTAQELSKVMETDYTIKLLTPAVNVRKLALGMGILIAVGIVVAVILHFMGILDLKEIIGGTFKAPNS